MMAGSIDRPSGGSTFKTQYQSPYVSYPRKHDHSN